VKRIGEIKSPVFITFGGKEPFIPTTVFSDNEDLIQDLLKPAVKIMTENNNQPVVKIYPDAAHFIHIDIPEKFNNDVLRFLKNNNISDIKNLSTDNTKSIVDTD
jgi:pimeloyl-ACP methyl ester carboxylesterase